MRLNVLADDKPLANGMNPAVLDEQVSLIIVHSSDNASVLDKDSCHRLPPRRCCLRILSLVCNTLSLFQMQVQAGLSHALLVPAVVRIVYLCRWSQSCSRRLL